MFSTSSFAPAVTSIWPVLYSSPSLQPLYVDMPFTRIGLQALVWTPIMTATVVLALRVFVRVQTRIFRIEDHLIVASWALAIATAGLAQAHLEADSEAAAGSYLYRALLVGMMSLSLGKSSITAVLLHLLDRTARWRRRFLIGTLNLFAISSVACLVVNIIPSCGIQRPPNVAPICLAYDGRIQAGIVIVWSILGGVIDASYSVIAWSIMRATQLSREKKIGLHILFGLGWIAAPFSILRPIASGALLNSNDLFWLSTSLELSLVIIGASASFLMPLFQYIISGKPIAPKARYQQPSEESGRRRPMIALRRLQKGNVSRTGQSTATTTYDADVK